MKTCTTTQAGKLASTIRHLTALVMLFLVCALPACTQETGRFTGHADGKSETACYLNAEIDAVRQAVNLFYDTRYKSEVRIINGKVDISQISPKGKGQLHYDVVEEESDFLGAGCTITIKAWTSTSNGGSAPGEVSTDSGLKSLVKHFEKACDGGDVEGCINLGLMYAVGKGVKQSDTTAASYYKKACDGGSARGCSNLGLMHAEGKGVKHSDVTAAKYYKKACDEGEALGCSFLGEMYENSKGVKQSKATAREYYKRACDGGDADGCDQAARLQ